MTSRSDFPAFPQTEVDRDGVTLTQQAGMTLRDYFAAKALQGLLSNPKLAPHILKQGGAHGGWIEGAAYGWADAMLKERDAEA